MWHDDLFWKWEGLCQQGRAIPTIHLLLLR